MVDIEEQLRRYGEALDRHLEARGSEPAVASPRRGRRWRVAIAAAVIGAVASSATIVTRNRDDAVVSTAPDTTREEAGVFSTPSDAVLLFSDGIDGVTAIDLDRQVAGRRVIDGERAGDQPFRLTLTGDQLVVGWGEIYAAPLAGGASRKIADATIYVPASEPGEVWTLDWPGGRIGTGTATARRVRVDGTTTFASDEFDASDLEPVIGVPGGILVNTPDGVAVWETETQAVGDVLGPGPATSATSDGRSLAWCESTCEVVHVEPLPRAGSPTAQHVAPGSQQLTMSSDGGQLAMLRPAPGRGADLVIRQSNGQERTVARDLDPTGSLQWSTDGHALFYSESSDTQPTMRVGRWDAVTGWELRTIPVGGGLAALVLTPAEARSFFSEELSRPSDCPDAGGTYPSGREGACAFRFSMPVPGTADGAELSDVDWARVRYPLDCAETLQGRVGWRVVHVGYAEPRPGRDLALVLVSCDAGAGSPPVALLVYDGATTESDVHLGDTLVRPEDNWLAKEVVIDGDRVSVPVHGYSTSGVPRCCPDVSATLEWRWTADGYELTSDEPAHYRN